MTLCYRHDGQIGDDNLNKIIEGSKYDTDTAKMLASRDNDLSQGDFKWCRETLYRTKAGKYFIHGEGGAMTQYAQSCGNNTWTGGERIEPMSREAAQKWAQECLDGDEYEDVFGKITEETEKEQLLLMVDPQLKQELWARAERERKTLSAMATELLEGALRK